MKRMICMIILAALLISAAVPAMAGGCDYRDTFGDHDWYQTGFNYPTCTEDGYYVLKCHECGYSKKESNGKAYGHNWEKSGEKAATCTAKGSASYWCVECGATKTDTVKALGHKYQIVEVLTEATCLEGGSERVKCSRCGDKTVRETGKTDHVYGEWELTVEATDASKGVRTSKCIYCGKEKTEEYYPEGTLYRSIKDEKEAVKTLQTQLTECGYLNDTIDGIFGGKTEQAVKDFQTAAGIAADGIAWPQTNKLLETEWQKLKGIYVEESEAVEEEMPATATCARIENEDGSVEFVYCADHKVLMDAADVLFEDAAPEEYIDVMLLVRQMYQEEVDMRFAEWLECSAEADKASVIGAQTMFSGLLSVQESVWNKQYGENSAEAITKINDMLRDQWMDLCAFIAATAAE